MRPLRGTKLASCGHTIDGTEATAAPVRAPFSRVRRDNLSRDNLFMTAECTSKPPETRGSIRPLKKGRGKTEVIAGSVLRVSAYGLQPDIVSIRSRNDLRTIQERNRSPFAAARWVAFSEPTN